MRLMNGKYDLYKINMYQKVRFMTHYYNLGTTRIYNFSSITTFYQSIINHLSFILD